MYYHDHLAIFFYYLTYQAKDRLPRLNPFWLLIFFVPNVNDENIFSLNLRWVDIFHVPTFDRWKLISAARVGDAKSVSATTRWQPVFQLISTGGKLFHEIYAKYDTPTLHRGDTKSSTFWAMDHKELSSSNGLLQTWNFKMSSICEILHFHFWKCRTWDTASLPWDAKAEKLSSEKQKWQKSQYCG